MHTFLPKEIVKQTKGELAIVKYDFCMTKGQRWKLLEFESSKPVNVRRTVNKDDRCLHTLWEGAKVF